MSIELTEREIRELQFYLHKNIIDAEGDNAMGISSKETVEALKSIRRKINNPIK